MSVLCCWRVSHTVELCRCMVRCEDGGKQAPSESWPVHGRRWKSGLRGCPQREHEGDGDVKEAGVIQSQAQGERERCRGRATHWTTPPPSRQLVQESGRGDCMSAVDPWKGRATKERPCRARPHPVRAVPRAQLSLSAPASRTLEAPCAYQGAVAPSRETGGEWDGCSHGTGSNLTSGGRGRGSREGSLTPGER